MSTFSWHGYEKKRIAKGNPYMACAGCGNSEPQINGLISGHALGCPQVELYLLRLDHIPRMKIIADLILEDFSEFIDDQIEENPPSVALFLKLESILEERMK
jgi:hypothetical protein